MLDRIWRWLRQLWQRWFDRPSTPQPVQSTSSRPVRSDAEYEALFLWLLEGINQGWGRGDVQGFLITHKLPESDLAEWLHRFGNRLLDSSVPHSELADRLTKLGALRVGALSQGAIDLASRLRPKPETFLESALHPAPVQPDRASSPATADEAETYLKQGVQKGLAGDLHGALDDFDHALQLNPNDDSAWHNRGVVLHHLERYEAAVESHDHALQLNPNDDSAWHNRGIALHHLERYEDEIESYDHALHLNPNYDTAWYNRGVALGHLERYEAAIESYDHALHLNPNYDTAWYNRGIALGHLERYEDEIESYDHALHLNPNNDAAWYNRGNALRDLERHEAAIESYDYALHLNPNNDLAWNNRGNALRDLERFSDAIESYDRALQLNHSLYQAWMGRGIPVGNLSYEITISPLLAITQQNSALNQPGYSGQLANYEEGLKHVKRNSDPEGWGQLHRAIGQAYYLKGKYETNSRSYWLKAFQSYHTAMETLTEQDFPKLHLELLQDLIRACLGLNDREAAKHWRVQGLRVLAELLNQQPDFVMKRRLEAKFSGLSQIAVDVLVQDGQIVAALEAAERYKNRCLTQILEKWQEQVVSPSYAQMRQWLNAETAIVYYHLSPDSLTTFVLKADVPEPIVAMAIGNSSLESRQQFRDWEAWLKEWNRDYEDYRGKKGKPLGNRRDHVWRRKLASRLERLQEILGMGAIESELSGISNLILIPHRDLHRLPLHALFDSERFTIAYLPSIQVGRNLQQRHPTSVNIWQDLDLLSVEDPQRQQTEPLKFAAIESQVISALFRHPTRIAPTQATLTTVSNALQQPHHIFHFTGHGDYNFHQPEQSSLGLQADDRLTAAMIRQQFDLGTYQLVSLSACETAVTGNQTIDSEYVGLVSAFLEAGAAHVVSTLWTVNEISNAWLMIRFYQELFAGNAPALALKQAQQWLSAIDRPQLAVWLLDLSQRHDLDAGIRERLEMYASVMQGDDAKDSSTIDLENLENSENLDLPPYDPYHWAAFTLTGKVMA